MEIKDLKKLLEKLKDGSISADESKALGDYKVNLVTLFKQGEQGVVNDLHLISKYGINYKEATSPIAQFWLKGVHEEISKLLEESLSRKCLIDELSIVDSKSDNKF